MTNVRLHVRVRHRVMIPLSRPAPRRWPDLRRSRRNPRSRSMFNAPSRDVSPDHQAPTRSKSGAGRPPNQVLPGAKVRVTQLDVAKAAGVHSTTVSLALRNNPAIPLATRERIHAVAEKLGYSPDPALSALVLYRRNAAPARRTETIAYVTHGKTRWGWRENPVEEQCFVGAQRKAAESGYQLEHFWLGEPGMSARRLSSVFFHRAITGILLASHALAAGGPLDFDWDQLTAVKIGHLPASPGIHRVTSDPAGDIRLAMRQAAHAGFGRIGLILPQEWDDRSDQAWSMGFLVEQARLPVTQRIPIFFHGGAAIDAPCFDPPYGVALDIAELGRWLFDFQPEVLLGSLPLISSALPRLGIEIPRDLGFIELQHQSADPAIAGIRQNHHRVGEVAVDLLISQLQMNLRGLPVYPTATLVEGAWCDGASISRASIAVFNDGGDGHSEQPAASIAV